MFANRPGSEKRSIGSSSSPDNARSTRWGFLRAVAHRLAAIVDLIILAPSGHCAVKPETDLGIFRLKRSAKNLISGAFCGVRVVPVPLKPLRQRLFLGRVNHVDREIEHAGRSITVILCRGSGARCAGARETGPSVTSSKTRIARMSPFSDS